MTTSDTLPPVIKRPHCQLLRLGNDIDHQLISCLFSICFAGWITTGLLAISLDSDDFTKLDMKIKVSLLSANTYIFGIIVELIWISCLQRFHNESTKPIGYIVNSDTNQDLEFITTLLRSPLSASSLELIQCLFPRNCSLPDILDDSQLANQANIIEKRYYLNDIKEGEVIGRTLGRVNGAMQYMLAVNVFMKEKPSYSQAVFSIFLCMVIGEYLTEPVFSKMFNSYSNYLGPRFTGRFFNVTANEIKSVYYPKTNQPNSSSLSNETFINDDIEQGYHAKIG